MSIWDVFQNAVDAANDIVDAYFIQSDLKDVYITEAESIATAHYDSMASNTSGGDKNTPIGKQVW